MADASQPKSPGTDDLFEPWCTAAEGVAGKHTVSYLKERNGTRPKAVAALQKILPTHYYPPDMVEKRLKKLGWEKTAKALRLAYPKTKKARSGDLGEILATEYVSRKLNFTVPVFRLRWKDGRELAMRGDDILAVRIDDKHSVHFLKGEAKSRKNISPGVLQEAMEALLTHGGRPSPHTLNYVVARLYEQKDALAETLDDYLTTREIPVKRVSHLLFVISGNVNEQALKNAANLASLDVPKFFVGITVDGHPELLEAVFEGGD